MDKEKYDKVIDFKRMQAKVDAGKQMDRLTEKAHRKANEAEQKLNAFCKRHGIENVDEYIKVSEC